MNQDGCLVRDELRAGPGRRQLGLAIRRREPRVGRNPRAPERRAAPDNPHS